MQKQPPETLIADTSIGQYLHHYEQFPSTATTGNCDQLQHVLIMLSPNI